jgi:hypothetical protein
MYDARLFFPGAAAEDARRLLDRSSTRSGRTQLTRTVDHGSVRPQHRRTPEALATQER